MHDRSLLSLVVTTAVFAGGLGAALTSAGGRSVIRSLIVGKDNRTSTSQCVALAWTVAVGYIFVALLLSKLFGNDAAWKLFDKPSSLADYAPFLGGALVAHVAARRMAIMHGKTQSPTPPTLSQVFSDDQGSASLGDFQYVLFNALLLVYVGATFVPHLMGGFPTLPESLRVLALTSAGAYTANKVFGEASSDNELLVVPPRAPVEANGRPPRYPAMISYGD